MAIRRAKSPLNSKTLLAAAGLGLVYCGLLYFHVRLSGENHIDGIVGVMLSLYISSLPAANLLNLLFYARDELRRGRSNEEYMAWWGLNILALFVGWLGIFLALIRFTSLH